MRVLPLVFLACAAAGCSTGTSITGDLDGSAKPLDHASYGVLVALTHTGSSYGYQIGLSDHDCDQNPTILLLADSITAGAQAAEGLMPLGNGDTPSVTGTLTIASTTVGNLPDPQTIDINQRSFPGVTGEINGSVDLMLGPPHFTVGFLTPDGGVSYPPVPMHTGHFTGAFRAAHCEALDAIGIE
jgi:hypothetical protein